MEPASDVSQQRGKIAPAPWWRQRELFPLSLCPLVARNIKFWKVFSIQLLAAVCYLLYKDCPNEHR